MKKVYDFSIKENVAKCSSYRIQTGYRQDTDRSSVDNITNVRHEASRRFRNKKKEYLKIKLIQYE